jgi:hypothetical protein
MFTKMIEVRDSGTTIAALAILMASTDETERRFLKHAGYPDSGYDGSTGVVLMKLSDCKATNDPYEWGSLGGARTMPVVHDYLIRNWGDVHHGQVIDVQVILGERATPKLAGIGMAR